LTYRRIVDPSSTGHFFSFGVLDLPSSQLHQSGAIGLCRTATTCGGTLDEGTGAHALVEVKFGTRTGLDSVTAQTLIRTGAQNLGDHETVIATKAPDLATFAGIFVGGHPASSMIDIASATRRRAQAQTVAG